MSLEEGKPASPVRKITVILFVDMVGYTALMHSDEQGALSSLDKFKKTLETNVPAFKGEIIQYYGDGCLVLFNSSVDATACAKHMQEIFRAEPEVPVRMGLHAGEVVLRDDNVFGDAVNIASRIESMGVPGSVLFSGAVSDQIRNQQMFAIRSLGTFEFKNVARPIELLALADDGLVVPEREEMQGKLKRKTAPAGGGFFYRLWKKKIPQVLAVYLAVAWLGFQLLNWVLPQMGLSWHWGKIFFMTAVGLLPIVVAYLNRRGRFAPGQWQWKEKILLPSNLLALGLVLFFTFRTADLGTVTRSLSFLNAEGVEETHNIVKEEFQIQIPVFPATPLREDTAHTWIGLAYAASITGKLSLNKYLFPLPFQLPKSRIYSSFSKVEKINFSKSANSDFYIDGTYQVLDEQFEITPAVRNKKTGEIIREKRFSGSDPFALVDSVADFLLHNIGLRPEQIAETPELPSRELFTDKLEAAKQFYTGILMADRFAYRMDKAIELDSNFVWAYFARAQALTNNAVNQLEARAMIDKAMQLRKKIPLQGQIDIMVYKHLAYEEWEKAEQLLKIQLEMDPNNELFQRRLSQVYFKTGQLEKAIDFSLDRFSRNPNPATGRDAMRALLMNGEPGKVIRRVNAYLNLDPHNPVALKLLAEAYIHKEDYEQATTTVEKIILTNPESEENLTPLLRAIDYMKTNGVRPEDLQEFTGDFRFFETERIYSHRLISNHIFAKHPHQAGFFLYPDSDSTLVYSSHSSFEKIERLRGQQGTVIGLKIHLKSRPVYYWKQDSIIWQAEDLVRSRDYEKARAAYRKAIEQHPDHYYLYGMTEHLDYLQRTPEEEVQENFRRIAGDYGDVKVWIEDGLLYYRPPGISRRILRPLSDNQFITMGNISMSYRFLENKGKIIAIEGYEFDHEKMEWVKYEPVYYERTRLPD